MLTSFHKMAGGKILARQGVKWSGSRDPRSVDGVARVVGNTTSEWPSPNSAFRLSKHKRRSCSTSAGLPALDRAPGALRNQVRVSQESELVATIAALANEQLDALESAVFVGWTDAESVAFSERRNEITLLRERLANLTH